MPLKATFFFSLDKWAWSETHYLTGLSILSSATGPCLQYAGYRAATLGNKASLDSIRVSEIPANRLVNEISPGLISSYAVWPADPSNEVYAADRAYSSLLLRLTAGIATKLFYFAGLPDSIIQSVRGSKVGFYLGGAPAWQTPFLAFMAYLTGSSGWGVRSRTAAGQVQAVGPPVTNAGFPAMVGIQTPTSLGVNVGDSVVLTKWRRLNPRIHGLGGIWRIGGILAPVAPATNWTYFLLNSGQVSPTNFATVGTIGPLAYQYIPYDGWTPVKSVSHKRGGVLRPASWEITGEPALASRFNPCGRAWTLLRRCYRFRMRLFVGGDSVIVPARWFFVDGLPRWDGPHGCEASPWLKKGERNLEWGEITEPHYTWDRGENPGYLGRCYIGEHAWFVDGRLPAGILSQPPLSLPPCCGRPRVGGPIQLGGQATGLAVHGPATPSSGSSGGSHGSSAPPIVHLIVGIGGPIQLGGQAGGVAAVITGGPIQLGGQATALAVAPGTPSSSAAASQPKFTGAIAGSIRLSGVVTGLVVWPQAGSSSAASGQPSGPASSAPSFPISSSGAGGNPEPCPYCSSGTAAQQYRFTLSGLTPGLCADCTACNATWTVSYVSPCFYTGTVTCCGGLLATLNIDPGTVTLVIGTGTTYRYIGSWDCMSPVALSGGSLGLTCLLAPSTLTVTPV